MDNFDNNDLEILETGDEKKSGGSKALLVIIGFVIVSFAGMLGSMMFFAQKAKQRKAALDLLKQQAWQAYQDSVAAAQPDTVFVEPARDGVQVAETPREKETKDTTVADFIPDTIADSLGQDLTPSQLKVRNKWLYEYLKTVQQKLKETRDSYSELSTTKEERDALAAQVNELSKDNEEKSEELAYYKDVLPGMINNKLNEIQTASDKLAKERAEAQTEQQQDVAANSQRLAKIYEAMRPENAAPILSRLRDDEIIAILMSMRQRQAAKVMTNFDPELAARISRKIQGR